MGLYNVVEPCVVGKLHYARPTAQPIEVDDTEAGPLVEAGSLTSYQPGDTADGVTVPALTGLQPPWHEDAQPPVDGPVLTGEPSVTEPDEAPAELPPRPRARRRTED